MEKSTDDAEGGGCQCNALYAICLVVNLRAFEFFLTLAVLVSASLVRGTLSTGNTYSINLIDIDGNKHSTADGHVTIVVLTTSADRERARIVGDHVPDFCLGNPAYRMITVVHFTGRHMAIGRRMAIGFIRHRVREEAKRLQARYDAQKISRDAKSDIFVVSDFAGTVASQLGQPAGATDFYVFVFGPSGELLAQWHGVPSTNELAAAIKKSH